jgi:hypothetical protein
MLKQSENTKNRLIFLVILGIVMFFVYSFLSFSVWLPKYQEFDHLIFNWPDATANFNFIQNFIIDSDFTINFSDNALVNNIVHPRSVNVYNTNLVPMSFLGFILLLGVLGKIITLYGIFFITPLVAIISVIFYYFLIKEIWSEEIAFYSSILLYFLGAYWYYATHVMLHTTLFVGLLVIGTYLLIKKDFSYLQFILGSVLVSMALTIRTIEIIWLLPLFIAMIFYFKPQKWFVKSIIFFTCLLITFVPILFLNNNLYGDYFSIGYFNLEDKGNLIEQLPTEFKVKSEYKVVSIAKSVLIPFGINIKHLAKSIIKYLILYYGAFLIFVMSGLFIYIKKKRFDQKQLFYIIASICISLWLIFYYGNWVFEDIDVLKYNFLSSSYIRYWLPIYILLLPGIGYFIKEINSKFNKKNIFPVIIILMLILNSVYFVLIYNHDNLFQVKENLETYYTRFETTKKIIEPNTILITDKTDKIFFPQYQCVVFLLDYSIFKNIKPLLDKYPVSYLTRMPDKDIEFINNKKINDQELFFTNPQIIDDEYRIFELNTVKP